VTTPQTVIITATLGASTTATVTVAQFGLEWPGNGEIRRMLYWPNPFPIYDATYIFRVYPRKKTVPTNSPTGYYTTFFWGNNGTFTWDSHGTANTYYGMHPYPIPPPDGTGHWEISVGSNDFTVDSEVVWDRWYTQAVRVWRSSPTTTNHEFYYDWPDASKVLSQTIVDSTWATKNPPNPAIVMGQAPDLCGLPPCVSGQSWGGYPGWEEFNGIIRGIQMYSGLLSPADIAAEIASPKSSTAGAATIWYLNLDPRPGDVTDKKGSGTPHDPLWAGSTALEWSGTVTSPPVVSALVCGPTSVTSGASTTCTVTLNQVASAAGSTVSLVSSSQAALPVATTVTVPGSASSTTFTTTAGSVPTSQTVTLTATLGGSATASVTVVPSIPSVSSLACAPASVTPAGSTTCTVALTQAAAAGGRVVTLSSSSTTALPVPGSVTVPANATSTTFTATAASVATPQTVTLTANAGISTTASVIILPAATLTSLAVSPASSSIFAGTTQQYVANGTYSDGSSQNVTTLVTWSSSATGVATISNTSGSQGLAASVGAGTATIGAVLGSVSGSTPLTVTNPPAGTIAFVQTAGATNDVAASTIAAAFTANNTAGNLIVVAVSWGDRTAPSISATDTRGNTYAVATNDFESGNRQGLAILYAPNIRAGANTVTVNLGASNAYRRIIISEYAGIAVSAPLDGVAKNRAAGTTASNGVTSTAATTTANGDLIFGVTMDDSGLFGTITAGTGFTRRAFVNNMDMATEDRVQPTAGSVAATFTFSRADMYLAQMAAFKSGSGGGGGSPSVSALACAPASVMSGFTTTCTVTLSQAAPSGGSIVTLASSNTGALPVPASVTVPAAATSATFTTTTGSVTTAQTVTVTATLGVSTTTTVTVTPSPRVSSVVCAPVSVVSGNATTCTVALNQAAPSGGSVVTLASSNTAALPVPASVTVPALATSATFTATAGSVSTAQSVTVTATLSGSVTATVSVTALPAVSSLACAPASVTSGAATTCTVTLTQPALPAGGAVALSSNNAAALPVPASVTVPASATSTTFTATAGSVATAQTITLTATLGASATATVTVAPNPSVSSLVCSPTSVISGAPTTCTVTLNQAALTGGGFVALSSSNPSVMSVPAFVTVASNTTSTTFTATAGIVTTPQTITLTATLGGSTTATVSVTLSPAQVRGTWSGPFTWPVVAANMVLMPTGKVLAWDLDNNAVQVWDPVANTFTDATNSAETFSFFGAGQTALADGRVLIDGGQVAPDVGSRHANAFNPAAQTWSALAPMAVERWSPTVITLADGRVLAVAGHSTCQTCVASTPEVYDPLANTWTALTGAQSSSPGRHPHLFVLPDGRIAQVGASEEVVATKVLDVGSQVWSTVDPNPLDGGSAVMYTPGNVMKSGGAWDADTGNPSTNTYVLDMNRATPAWRQTAGMAFPRVTHNLTLLPDGTVLATGGSGNPFLSDPASVVYDAELWSPSTETWTPMAQMQVPRMQNSTALLLPDGRVLTAGGGRFGGTGPGVDQFSSEIYSPTYLAKGARPTIASAPGAIGYGSTFNVLTPDAAQIAGVSLVRLGSVTHSFNNGQRFLWLAFQQISGGLSVTAPLNGSLAPPGYYMLFILNTNGVPSVAAFLQIQ